MNYQSSQNAVIGGQQMKVDTFEASCCETRSQIAAHFFNDGEGVAFGTADPRSDGTASIVLSRADAVALVKWLIERGLDRE